MVLINNANDHWAFLEEIEAPMWVDFTVEEKSNYQDVDDKWFHTSHPFHQCTSRQLKAAFAHSSERESRRKHYASKKGGGGDCDLSLNKKHPVKVFNGTSRSKLSMVSGKSITGKAKEIDFKAKSGQGGSGSSLNSGMVMVSDSNTSTATFASDHQARHGNLEVLSRGLDHTSGLLSAVRNGLRKSFVTRKASRVEINDENKQLRDRKSSSSKSSVGSSLNPGYDVKSSTLTLMRNKEQTPDSRNVVRMTEAARKKTKDSNMSKTSDVRVKEKVFNSRKRATSNVSKSAPQEALKSKVQKQTPRVITLAEHRSNEQHSLPGTAKAREKVRVSRLNKMVAPGKENMTGKMALSQNCSSKGTKLNVAQKDDKTVLVRQKSDALSFKDVFGLQAQVGKNTEF
ncbi:hypothetical protein OIU74_006125 [Salix koriyanagi]|uniref:Uncharacterized protein n=1 Tax=Salix koriyanagi TaxID=2511006 RepID=A0A9Q0ZB46_9ROSI|nr:hypothetical protein OIU74_006125 [Salix koriyanagi]